FKSEVREYNGAVLVLFDSTCDGSQYGDNIERNMELVYLNLADKFMDAKVNGLPLKFATFDGCKYTGNNARALAENGVTTVETHMYLRGKEIDVMRGGPLDERGVSDFKNDMSLWIEYTLLGIKQIEDRDKDVVALFKGDFILEAYPRSEILQK
ncbi:hypothetical protein HZA98_00495, partial [Candidatus Woesearchaeota archaeon]|nr:hypothetical protein [Candidatus Woesearchaeota archaeon]